MLEKMTKQHGSLVEASAHSVRRMVEDSVNTEVSHYDGLKLLTPEKAKNINSFQVKQELSADIKAAEEQSYKVDLQAARQKILELADGAVTHQSMAPFCQYVSDAAEFYGKVSEKWGKYLSSLLAFFQELNSIERSMSKQLREANTADKKRKEQVYGGFQSTVFELVRNLEIKEKNHSNYTKFLDISLQKLD